jgi:hypothetical protein
VDCHTYPGSIIVSDEVVNQLTCHATYRWLGGRGSGPTLYVEWLVPLYATPGERTPVHSRYCSTGFRLDGLVLCLQQRRPTIRYRMHITSRNILAPSCEQWPKNDQPIADCGAVKVPNAITSQYSGTKKPTTAADEMIPFFIYKIIPLFQRGPQFRGIP